MNIGVDLDEVVGDLMPALVGFYKKYRAILKRFSPWDEIVREIGNVK